MGVLLGLLIVDAVFACVDSLGDLGSLRPSLRLLFTYPPWCVCFGVVLFSLIRSVCGVLSLCFLCLVENMLLALALFPCGFCLSVDFDPMPFLYAFSLRLLELVLPQPGCGYCQNPPPLSVVIKPSGLGSVLLSM